LEKLQKNHIQRFSQNGKIMNNLGGFTPNSFLKCGSGATISLKKGYHTTPVQTIANFP